MKLPSSWIFFVLLLLHIHGYFFIRYFFSEDRRFTSTIIQSFIFSTLLVAFFWYRKTAKTKNQ